jgi:hypothetical protein
MTNPQSRERLADELQALEQTACMMSQAVIAFALSFLLVAALTW